MKTVRIRVKAGSYPWTNSNGIPGTDLMEIGEHERDASPYTDGLRTRYRITLEDGKRVFVEGEQVKGGTV